VRGGDPAECPLKGKGQLGERVHEAKVSLAGQRGEDGVSFRWGHVRSIGQIWFVSPSILGGDTN
jgi:hypothetical protein